jgi:hypothetical protein
MIPKKHAPDLIRGGYRFSEKIMLQQNLERALIHSQIAAWALRGYQPINFLVACSLSLRNLR